MNLPRATVPSMDDTTGTPPPAVRLVMLPPAAMAGTVTTCGPLATLVTAMKSFCASKGIFGYMCGLTVKMLPEVISSV